MLSKYSNWIQANYPTWKEALGDCATAVEKMKESFPELEIKAGWLCGMEHWWLVDSEGNIIDPTIVQYTGRGTVNTQELKYKEFKPGDRVRVGRCMNCGEDIYKKVKTLKGNRLSICSETCEELYRKYIEGEMA